MPFMVGPAPIRRTLNYLKNGSIILRDSVRIFSINYNHEGANHEGARNFAFWHLPQLQFQNPTVQCLTFVSITPSPFIRVYLENCQSFLIDVDDRSRKEIHDHLLEFTAICKGVKEIEKDRPVDTGKDKSFGYFGYGCLRQCLCELPGQVPCPAVAPLPKHMRGKYRVPKD